MELISIFSIGAEINALIISVIIAVIMSLQKRHTITDKNIHYLVIMAAIIMANDVLATELQGRSGQIFYIIVRVSNVLLYMTNYMIMIVYGKLIYDYTKPKKKLEIVIYHMVGVICVASVIALIISQFCNWFYYFDDNNVYHRAALYPLAQIAPVVGVVSFLYIILANRKKMQLNILIASLAYIVLPFTATIVQIFVYGVPAQNLSVVFATWFLYSTRELEIRNELAAALEQITVQKEKINQVAAKAEEANLAKSIFLTNMSHDIRTPLNGIIGLLRLDERHPDDKEFLRENRAKMEEAANNLLSLVDDVLQMSKLENGMETLAYESVSLKDLSKEVVEIIGKSIADKDILWQYNDEKLDFPYVMTSPLHLRQIFLNIYENSVKYTKQGATISTTLEFMGVKKNVVTYRWIISDTGTGMSDELLEQIFEPFLREEYDVKNNYYGTGFGLTIVKSLVDQMGGKINVTSEVQKGTTFVIEIPFEVASPPVVSKAQLDMLDRSIKGFNLLVAEDNELNAEITRMMLSDSGATVNIVSNGKKVVRTFEKSVPGTFDAILMDMMMPEMDGLEATKAIRALDRRDAKTIPIIALTANAFAEDAKKCLDAGMDAHLAKPLELNNVIDTVNKLCKSRKMTQ